MSPELEAAIQPLDWLRIKQEFPLAAWRLESALDPFPFDTVEAREEATKIEAVASALLGLRKAWDDLPDFTKQEVTHWSRSPQERDSGTGGGRQIIDRCIDELLPSLELVHEGMRLRGVRDGRKTRKEPERAIAASLALVYALATEREPKCYNSVVSGGAGGEYGEILERLLLAAGFQVGDLRKLTEPLLKALTPAEVASAREAEKTHKLRARFLGRSLFHPL